MALTGPAQWQFPSEQPRFNTQNRRSATLRPSGGQQQAALRKRERQGRGASQDKTSPRCGAIVRYLTVRKTSRTYGV